MLSAGVLTALSATAKLSSPTVAGSADLIDAVLCGLAPSGPFGGFRNETTSAQARMHRAMTEAPLTGDPDRDFALGMIPHHQGAIDMARIQLKYGRDERLRRLAQALIVEQSQEIAYLRTVLDQLGSNDRPDLGPSR
jgi:hypothetical protein